MKKVIKKIINFVGIEWIFLIIALAYIDGTLAIFFIMFFVPVIFGVFQVGKLIINKFKHNLILKKSLRILSVILAITATFLVTIIGIRQNSPDELFRAHIVDPIPESVDLIKRGGTLSVFGVSSFFITFDIDSSDFNKISGLEKFRKSGIDDITGQNPVGYQGALSEAAEYIDDISQIYIKDDEIRPYRGWILITNKAHNKVYYRVY